MPKRLTFRLVWLLALVAAAAFLLVPLLSADRFQEPLRSYLETTLQRSVQVGEVRFSLWGGPGFRLRNVVIDDHPSISVEPLAYVSEAQLKLGLASLWRRELVFSSITLVQPSLNIAQGDDGNWNYQRLMRSPADDSGGPAERTVNRPLPTIVVQGGRVNFRQGLLKSVYFFRNANLRLEKEDIGTEAWLVEFRAEPARTDSFAPRFGTVRGQGRWRAGTGLHGELDLDVAIERSPLAELAALFGLPRVGLNGYATARAHLSGPGDSLELRGRLELQELGGRGFLLSRSEERGMQIEGTLSVPERSFSIHTVPRGEDPLPYHASLDFAPPEFRSGWRSSLRFAELPVETILETAQYFDDASPRYAAFSGMLSGEIEYQSEAGLTGQIHGSELVWKSDEDAGFCLRDLELRIQGDDLSGTARIDADSQLSNDLAIPVAENTDLPDVPEATGAAFAIQLHRSSGQLSLKLSGDEINRRHLDIVGRLVPLAAQPIPLLQGNGWRGKGNLQWSRASFRHAGEWKAQLSVRDVETGVAGFRQPVHFQSGTLEIAGERWDLLRASGTLNGVTFRGDLKHVPGDLRPYQFVLRTKDLDLAALDAAVAPAMQSPRGFFQRTFVRSSISSTVFPQHRSVLVKFSAESVLINNSRYSELEGQVYWDGSTIEIRNIRFQSRFGRFHGFARAILSGSRPAWNASLSGANDSWDGGTLDMELQRQAQGGLGALFGDAAGEANLVWHNSHAPGLPQDSVLRARLIWEGDRAEPEICEHCIELRSPEGIWLGSCNQSNGTGYRCLLEDPRTSQQLEMELPMSMVGTEPK